LQEEIDNVCCNIIFVAGNEAFHLEELIDYHHNSILSSRDLWDGHNEVHDIIIPRP